MQTVEVGGQIQPGRNELTVRLRLTKATDGLLDLLKLLGDFAVREGQVPALVAPPATVEPASWTDQGYPFLSGRAAYRTRFDRPGGAGGRRVFLEPALVDDVVEVVVNGQSAGVRLWPPYGIEVTDLLQDGDNVLELRVANTLVNLLEAVRRPSGLSGAPRLVAYAPVTLELGS
jgi:hypothetical protein